MPEIHAVTVPKWGLSMEEGTIVLWRVAEGSEVAPGADLAEIETTKITNTLEAQRAGKLRRILAQPGQTLPCGQLIAVIANDAASDQEIDAFIETHQHILAEEGDGAAARVEPLSRDVAGRKIRFLDQGQGPGAPVFLIHGFGGDLENWMFNQPALSSRRRTVSIDLPGHGGSDKDVGPANPPFFAQSLAGLLDALEIERVHVVAHSFGAAVAAALVETYPSRVASVTAIGPMGFGTEVNAAYTNGFITARRRSEMTAVVRMLFANEELATSDMAENLLRYKRLDGAVAALEAISAEVFPEGAQRPAAPEIWQGLGGRLFVLWGAEDKVIPSSHLNAVPAGAKRALIDGAGHMPHLEKADHVNDLIGAYLDGLEN